jgi:periplasmic protein TonB
MLLNTPTHPNPETARGDPPSRKPHGNFTPAALGSWRYAGRPRSRWVVVGSIAVALGFHAWLFYGFHHGVEKPIQRNVEVLALDLQMPKMEELEDPAPELTDNPAPAEELGLQVPMQADSPQLPQPSDFVQELDFASMTPQPNIDRPKMFTIPANINRSGKLGEGLGKIFDLKDLDRQPVPIFQPPPIPPSGLVQEGSSSTVWVEFIVLGDGSVSQAIARNTTDYRFNEAAVRGVSRWKFKPGFKNGRKVNTRMMVPIVFKPPTDND